MLTQQFGDLIGLEIALRFLGDGKKNYGRSPSRPCSSDPPLKKDLNGGAKLDTSFFFPPHFSGFYSSTNYQLTPNTPTHKVFSSRWRE